MHWILDECGCAVDWACRLESIGRVWATMGGHVAPSRARALGLLVGEKVGWRFEAHGSGPAVGSAGRVGCVGHLGSSPLLRAETSFRSGACAFGHKASAPRRRGPEVVAPVPGVSGVLWRAGAGLEVVSCVPGVLGVSAP